MPETLGTMKSGTTSFGSTSRQWHAATIPLLLVLALAWALPANAFHGGGVATCASCHVMHASIDGQVLLEGGEAVLVGPTATDVCLTCHGGQAGVFGANPLSPPPEKGGGNFVFLLEDNINDGPDGLINPISGTAAGHNVVSYSMGSGVDRNRQYGPGGIYPSSALSCTSCHDPHGNQNFRMLHGVGPIQDGFYTFLYPAPVAEGLDVTDPLAIETSTSHTAYRSGMSEWCSNCHGEYHDDSNDALRHRFLEDLHGDEQETYDRYDGASNPQGGIGALAYLPEVPFEDPASSITRTQGPGSMSVVMCLTCHRAHASSAPQAGRWDFNVGNLDQDGMISGSHPLPNPYPGPNQNSLCNKCHYPEIPN